MVGTAISWLTGATCSTVSAECAGWCAGGGFEALGTVRPRGDLWIVYSDGFHLDHRRLGFARARDYFDAQLEFHRRQLDSGLG